MTTQFQVGQTYNRRSIVSITITRRTEKSVWFEDFNGKEVRRKIQVYEGLYEYINYDELYTVDARGVEPQVSVNEVETIETNVKAETNEVHVMTTIQGWEYINSQASYECFRNENYAIFSKLSTAAYNGYFEGLYFEKIYNWIDQMTATELDVFVTEFKDLDSAKHYVVFADHVMRLYQSREIEPDTIETPSANLNTLDSDTTEILETLEFPQDDILETLENPQCSLQDDSMNREDLIDRLAVIKMKRYKAFQNNWNTSKFDSEITDLLKQLNDRDTETINPIDNLNMLEISTSENLETLENQLSDNLETLENQTPSTCLEYTLGQSVIRCHGKDEKTLLGTVTEIKGGMFIVTCLDGIEYWEDDLNILPDTEFNRATYGLSVPQTSVKSEPVPNVIDMFTRKPLQV